MSLGYRLLGLLLGVSLGLLVDAVGGVRGPYVPSDAVGGVAFWGAILGLLTSLVRLPHERRMRERRLVIRIALDELLKAGYWLRVHGRQKWATDYTDDPAVILDAMEFVDEERLHVYGKNRDGGYVRIGSFSLGYDSPEYEIVAYYELSLAEVLRPLGDLASRMNG